MVPLISMKFCKRRKHEYETPQGVATSSHYVTEQDILAFHGLQFTEQWKQLAHHKCTNKFGRDVGYFYDDYQYFARATDSFINVI